VVKVAWTHRVAGDPRIVLVYDVPKARNSLDEVKRKRQPERVSKLSLPSLIKLLHMPKVKVDAILGNLHSISLEVSNPCIFPDVFIGQNYGSTDIYMLYIV